MQKQILILALVFILSACGGKEATESVQETIVETASKDNTPDAQSAAVSLEEKWKLSGLDSPESIIPSQDGKKFYVSNVNGEAADKDGNGYISTISRSGELLEKNWVMDLDGPKGMALLGNILYVSDIDTLIAIDTHSGQIVKRIPVDGAGFLNDVHVMGNEVLVSDSANARIYLYDHANSEISIWLQDALLGGVNGLHQEGDEFYITTMGTAKLLKLDLKTKQLTTVAEGLKNSDGIGYLNGNGYLISSWPGEIYHVSREGEVKSLLNTREQEIYANDIYFEKDRLYVPNWKPGTVTAYKVHQ